MRRRDYREFVFTATGEGASTDLHDNFVAEVDRLKAIVELLLAVRAEEFDSAVLPGVGLLLRDVQDRMTEILRAGRGEK